MDTDEIRDSLASEAERLATMRDDIRVEEDFDSDLVDRSTEISSADQHPADAASEQQQREIDLSLLEQVEAELSDVERALHKLDQGTYGTCEACGEPIGEERLVAQPAARFCVDDQAQAEKPRFEQ